MLEEQTQQAGSPARTLIAIILLGLAIPLGIWVLTIVNATIKDKEAERPAILQKVYPDEDKPVSIKTPNGQIELPPELFKGFSYTILFMFLLIPSSIAMALLKGGITLLKPDLTTKMMRGLVESLVKIQAQKE